MKLYKTTRPDGTFHTGTVDDAAALTSGEVLHRPSSTEVVANQPATYLSTSVEPAETLLGGKLMEPWLAGLNQEAQ